MRTAIYVCSFLLVTSSINLCASSRLAILPFEAYGIEESARRSAYKLLLAETRVLDRYEVIPESEISEAAGDTPCIEAACAIRIAEKVNADLVVYGSLNKLGEKIIVQYNLIEISSGKPILSDDLAALRLEDLDQVMKRIAASIVKQVPAEETIEVGLVTENESLEPGSRKANMSWGVAFGYLYPTKGYGDDERSFVFDFRSVYEMPHLAVDAVLGGRQGFVINVGALYLFSRKDFSPFVGGGVGFHNVAHDIYPDYQDGYQNTKREDGFEVLLKAGITAFRTYDFRVIATVEYSLTFNDYDDRAVVLTIGILRAGKRVFGIF